MTEEGCFRYEKRNDDYEWQFCIAVKVVFVLGEIYITVKEKCTIIVVKESEKYGGLYRLQYEVYPDYLSNVECYGEDRIVQVVKDVFNEYAGVQL